MRGRSKDVTIFVGDSAAARSVTEGRLCKYLCGNCGQLRMPNPGQWPSHCGGCGSDNIDRETDFANQRLELLRVSGDPHALRALIAEVAKTPKGRAVLDGLGIEYEIT